MKNIKKLVLAGLMLCGTMQVKPSGDGNIYFPIVSELEGILIWAKFFATEIVKNPKVFSTEIAKSASKNKILIAATGAILYSLYHTGKTHLVQPTKLMIKKAQKLLNDFADSQGLANPFFVPVLAEATEDVMPAVSTQTAAAKVVDSLNQTDADVIELAEYVKVQFELYKRKWFEALENLDIPTIKSMLAQNADIIFIQKDSNNAFGFCEAMFTDMSQNHIKNSKYEDKISKLLEIRQILASSQQQIARL